MSKLLIVDDEQSISWGLSQIVGRMGHQVCTAFSAEDAFVQIESFRPDAIVLDVRLPGMDGISAIERFRSQLGAVPIVVITAYGDLETAVEATRRGAFEYVLKPFDLSTVERVIERALSVANVEQETVPTLDRSKGIIGRSPPMQEVFKQIALASTSDSGVLLCGESGTGKELAAWAIHQYSKRAAGPFVPVNIASLSPTLTESELFGHVRGAFTGADRERTGYLSQAHGGTLFLDEIADIPLVIQGKLLRVLEQGEIVPVGASEPVRANFRIISATHFDLLRRVQSGSFRSDLYFRLGALRIEMPPLRDRGNDIVELATQFLRGLVPNNRQSRFSETTVDELKSRPWFGNVRELRNAVEHAVVFLRGGVIEREHLPPAVQPTADHSASVSDESIRTMITRWAEFKLADSSTSEEVYEQLLQLVEPPLLNVAMEKHRGLCIAAARQLGLHRTTLRRKLDAYQIDGR